MIYFVQSGEQGPIKIGRTKGGYSARRDQLQTGNPQELRLLGTAFSGCADVGGIEREVHSLFSAHRLPLGEWFEPVEQLFFFVNAHNENGFEWVLNKVESFVHGRPVFELGEAGKGRE